MARYPSLKLIATDKNGVVFPVIFSIDIEEAYLGQFTVGHTVAILYAHPRLLDRIMRMGIKQEEIKKCKVGNGNEMIGTYANCSGHTSPACRSVRTER